MLSSTLSPMSPFLFCAPFLDTSTPTDSPIDEYDGDEGELILDVTAPDLAVLIGTPWSPSRGSCRTLFSLLVSRKLGFRYPVVVDVEGYKSRRQDKVVSMAQSAAARALSQGRSVKASSHDRL